jgi:ATPase family AAA domain-containing protein 3A/B
LLIYHHFFSKFLSFAWQERQRVVYDEQRKLAQHQAQTKSQMARYEDELARKRMQACIINILG